jgi:hypothetical protein
MTGNNGCSNGFTSTLAKPPALIASGPSVPSNYPPDQLAPRRRARAARRNKRRKHERYFLIAAAAFLVALLFLEL